MGTRILINTQSLETRVAVLDDDTLVDFELEREQRIVGSIFKGRVVNVVPGMDAAFVDVALPRNAFLYVSDVDPAMRGSRPHHGGRRRYGSIREALTAGEDLLVQVVRPPVGSKGARVTTRLTLQGRFAVLMVGRAENLGVSRQIQDRAEQKRLRKLAQRLRPLEHGLVLRTDAQGRTEEDIRTDLDTLVSSWGEIQQQAEQTDRPALLHQEMSLGARVVRDRFGPEIDEVLVDSAEEHECCRSLLARMAPELQDRLKLHQAPTPLFDAFGVEDQVRQALARRVPLPSGGSLTVDETEALTTIDVDTGSFVGSKHLADTVLKANLEAVRECARQIRLRDLGGIIIIDFIDMDRVRDRVQVMDALQAELRHDRMRPRIVHLSPLGLVELTRRRRGLSLSRMLRVPCPYCSGLGEVCSATTVAAETRRELLRRCAEVEHEAALLSVHPEVAAALLGHEGDTAAVIEAETGIQLFVEAAADAHAEQMEVETGPQASIAALHPSLEVGQVLEVSVHGEQAVPHGHPLYAAVDGCLVLLPALTDHEQDPLRLRVTETGRWFCRAEIAH